MTPMQSGLNLIMELYWACYVHITKCLADTKYRMNPHQTVLNKDLVTTTQSGLDLILQLYWTSVLQSAGWELTGRQYSEVVVIN